MVPGVTVMSLVWIVTAGSGRGVGWCGEGRVGRGGRRTPLPRVSYRFLRQRVGVGRVTELEIEMLEMCARRTALSAR